MEVDPPTTPPVPSKRKSPSDSNETVTAFTTDLPQPRSHKRQRTVERKEPADKPSDSSPPNQHTTSPEKIVESENEDEESGGERTVSDPMDIESEDTAGNHLHIADDLGRALERNTRRPILAPVEPELSTSDIDDLLSDSEFDLDSDDEEFKNSVTKKSNSHRSPSRNEEEYYTAMCDIDYYNSLPELELRREAIRWMEKNSKADPKGTVVYPPPWYIATCFDPPRPKIWIKDFFSGKVRPRQLVNDRLAEMSVAQREQWAMDHGMGGGDDEDTE